MPEIYIYLDKWLLAEESSLWNIKTCKLVCYRRLFGSTCRLHLQGSVLDYTEDNSKLLHSVIAHKNLIKLIVMFSSLVLMLVTLQATFGELWH